jgi:hypothetical protein
MGLVTNYSRSVTCKFHIDLFFKTFADCLDFSSLAQHSFLHKAVTANSTCPKALELMIYYLSQLTRNKPFLWKLEGKGEIARSLISPSPKQYRIRFYREVDLDNLLKLEQRQLQGIEDNDDHRLEDDDVNAITKLKGVRRSLLFNEGAPIVTDKDFEQAECFNINTKLTQYSIRTTKDFQLYVVGLEKRIITQLSTKRYFDPTMDRDGLYTSLPIGLRLSEDDHDDDDQ